MKIITVFFARKKKYNKLLKVFQRSLKKEMPGSSYEIVRIKKPENIDHKRDTAYAFLAACEYALKSKEVLAICDTDLLFTGDIRTVEEKTFDIAITTRNSIKYNTGLWFFKPTKKARLFLKRWMKNTKLIMDNFCRFEDFSWQHGGIDQASLYLTIQKNNYAKILELPCKTWNATQSEWKFIDENTKVIHIKSQLRGFCVGDHDIDEKFNYLIPIIEKWRSYLK